MLGAVLGSMLGDELGPAVLGTAVLGPTVGDPLGDRLGDLVTELGPDEGAMLFPSPKPVSVGSTQPKQMPRELACWQPSPSGKQVSWSYAEPVLES